MMNFGDNFAGFAVQVSGTSLGLFFKLVVTFVGRGFVANRVGFLFVDRLFFHGSGSGEDRSLFMLWRCLWRRGVAVVLFFEFLVRRSLGRSAGKFLHRFLLSFLLKGDNAFARP